MAMVNEAPDHDDMPTGPKTEGVPPDEDRSPWAPAGPARVPDQRWDDGAARFDAAQFGPAQFHPAQFDPATFDPAKFDAGHRDPGQQWTAPFGPAERRAPQYGPPLEAPPPGAPHGADWVAGSFPSPVRPVPPGAQPDSPVPYPHPSPYDARRERAPVSLRVLALGLAAVLLAGVVGGVVGHSLATGGRSGGSSGVLGGPLPAVEAASGPEGPVEAVASRVLPSVVQLRVDGAGASGEGSAMVLSEDGLLLTNNHVVEPAANLGRVTAVFQDGTTAAAQIVGRDPSSDLAVLRAQNVSGLAPVELGNSESVRVGQPVVAFGSPLGLGGTVTTGIISAVDRAVSVGEQQGANVPTVLNALQTDAAINPGNSGGPLVDMEGRVVGINSAIATTGAQGGSIGVGFSIPINQARRVAEELERTGRASRAVLGVTVADDPQRAGALIRTVVPDGAAALAGILEGDLVLRFGDQRISTGTDLQAAVGSRAPGEVVEVELADRTVSATLAAAPN
jgi:putative serine protease PepD